MSVLLTGNVWSVSNRVMCGDDYAIISWREVMIKRSAVRRQEIDNQIHHHGKHRLLSGKTNVGLCTWISCLILIRYHTNPHSLLSWLDIPSRHHKITGHHRPGLYHFLILIVLRRILKMRHRHSIHHLYPLEYTVLRWRNPLTSHCRNSLQLHDGKFLQPPLDHSEERHQGRANRTRQYRSPLDVWVSRNQETCCIYTPAAAHPWRQYPKTENGTRLEAQRSTRHFERQ